METLLILVSGLQHLGLKRNEKLTDPFTGKQKSLKSVIFYHYKSLESVIFYHYKFLESVI